VVDLGVFFFFVVIIIIRGSLSFASLLLSFLATIVSVLIGLESNLDARLFFAVSVITRVTVTFVVFLLFPFASSALLGGLVCLLLVGGNFLLCPPSPLL
jgi:hypothetical protein